MRKKKNISKVLIVSDFGFRTLEIKIDIKKRIVLLSIIILIVGLTAFSFYKYNFYKKGFSSLLSDSTIAVSSINQMSSDEIRIRKEIVKLKSELQAINNFLKDASSIDEEVKRNLKIKYSNVTFADIFSKNARIYDRAHPASGDKASVDKEATGKLIEESLERKKSYEKLMEVTPSGFPVDGDVTASQEFFKGTGVALITPYGSPIRATARGKIKEVREIKDESYIIEIEHQSDNGHNILTRYLFCKEPLVFVGKEVNKGQIIAYSGFYPGSFNNIVGYQIIVDNTFVQP